MNEADPLLRRAATYWDMSPDACWACGMSRKVERCHIVPKALGGPLEAENIVLLCKSCHLAAPDVADPIEMWRWIHGQRWIGLDFALTLLRDLDAQGVPITCALGAVAVARLDDLAKRLTVDHNGIMSRATFDWLARVLAADLAINTP